MYKPNLESILILSNFWEFKYDVTLCVGLFGYIGRDFLCAGLGCLTYSFSFCR